MEAHNPPFNPAKLRDATWGLVLGELETYDEYPDYAPIATDMFLTTMKLLAANDWHVDADKLSDMLSCTDPHEQFGLTVAIALGFSREPYNDPAIRRVAERSVPRPEVDAFIECVDLMRHIIIDPPVWPLDSTGHTDPNSQRGVMTTALHSATATDSWLQGFRLLPWETPTIRLETDSWQWMHMACAFYGALHALKYGVPEMRMRLIKPDDRQAIEKLLEQWGCPAPNERTIG